MKPIILIQLGCYLVAPTNCLAAGLVLFLFTLNQTPDVHTCPP
jgi:hypothetical protein